MKIFHGTENANIQKPTVLTLGVFDGLHLGHQQIMQTVVERARAANAVPTAITFDPHPRAVLHPESAPPLLQTLDQRLANLEVLGIEQAIVSRSTREFAVAAGRRFLADIVHDRLHAKEVYLGKGFAFGKGRGGNIELLRKMSSELGFVADEVPRFAFAGSGSVPRRSASCLAEGRVNLARRMLGRPYGVEGVIIRGNRRGHTDRLSDRKSETAQPRHPEVRRLRDSDAGRRHMAAEHNEHRRAADVRAGRRAVDRNLHFRF